MCTWKPHASKHIRTFACRYAFKPPKQKGIDLEALQRELKKGGKGKNKKQNAQKMQQIIAEQQGSSGPAMMFATVDYPGCCDNKKMSEELANKWSSLLHASSIEQTAYVVQNNTILFSTQVAMAAKEIKEFSAPAVAAISVVARGILAAVLES